MGCVNSTPGAVKYEVASPGKRPTGCQTANVALSKALPPGGAISSPQELSVTTPLSSEPSCPHQLKVPKGASHTCSFGTVPVSALPGVEAETRSSYAQPSTECGSTDPNTDPVDVNFTAQAANVGKPVQQSWQRSAVDKGTQLIEALSTIDGTAVEKVEAFSSLLVQESYVQFASISVLSEDEQVFMVLTATGVGSDFLPKHYLLSVASSNWSVQRVVAEGSACFWSASDKQDANELPEDWKCLYRTQKLRCFLAVPIKVGTVLCGVLNVALATEVDDQRHWWLLQLRLLAAVMAQHFREAHLRSKISWLQLMTRQETLEQLTATTLRGLENMFSSLHDLHFYLCLVLPGRPCAIMFSLQQHQGQAKVDTVNAQAQFLLLEHTINPSECTQEQVDMHGFMMPETVIENALETGQVMKVVNCRRYLRLYRTGSDIAILYRAEMMSPASVKVYPLIAPDGARIGGLYVVSRTSTSFGMVRREVLDLSKLMVPTLQQKLYSELNKKLIQISENCKFESSSVLCGADEVDSPLDGSATKELLQGTKPEKDSFISELQDQIRKQLAKVYKGHQDGITNPLADLEVYDELGRGGYGTVYRAMWKGQLVAVKVVCDRDIDGSSLNGALELALLTSISHPNIIQIHTYFADVPLHQVKFVRGASSRQAGTKSGDQICQVLVMDYCDMGSLADVLNTSLLRHHAGRVAMPAILHCLQEVAAALFYLHSIGIVHYDLKPENVLLKSSTIDSRGFTCKVADFGLSHFVNDNSYFHKHAEGTITHLAPEAMHPNGKLTRAVDVYALGIMMWELYSGLRPYLGFRTIDVAVKVSKEKLRPEFPSSTPPAYRQLAESCWQEDRRQRPTFRQVLEKLSEMLRDEQIMGRDTSSSYPLGSPIMHGRLPVLSDGGREGMREESGNCDFPLHIL